MADVLVVDDESAVGEILTRWLRAAGHAPREAEGAPAALEAMSKREAGLDAMTRGIEWHTETTKRGPWPEDSPHRLASWLGSIDAGLDLSPGSQQ